MVVRTPYQYLWSTGDTEGSVTVSPTSNTVYSVTVTDAVGCTATDNLTVIVEEVPQVTNVSTVSPSCAQSNGSITLDFNDNPNQSIIEFSLDGGNNYTVSIPDNSGSTTFSNLSAGVYNIYARWGNDSCPREVAEVQLSDDAGTHSRCR